MDFINLKSLNLTDEKSEDVIKLLAKKRGINTKELLSTIKLNLKVKNKKDLASKSQQKIIKSIKSQQKLAKTQLEIIKSQRKTKKTLSNTNVDKKINNTNVDKKINNTNVDKKINNTNDEDFIENFRDLFNNKLDKKINNNNTNYDFIENIRDLFSILHYEPVLIKSGFDNNYLEYMGSGDNSLSFNEYLELIKPYLYDLINAYKVKGEWKLQIIG